MVEQNSDIRGVVEHILQLAGYMTVGVASAIQAQELTARQLPDVILVDLGLVGIDGFKFARMLRASPLTQHIPLLGITSHPIEDDEVRAMAAGFDGLVSKPIQRVELLNAITSILGRDS